MHKKGSDTGFIDLRDQKDIDYWCRKLECSEHILRLCLNKVGRSRKSVEAYLHMNRDWLIINNDQSNQQMNE